MTCGKTDILMLSHRKGPASKVLEPNLATKDINIILPPVQLMQPIPSDTYRPDGAQVNVTPAVPLPGAHVQDEFGSA